MLTDRKFFKTVFTIEVLSEDPLSSSLSLTDIEFTEGYCSGTIRVEEATEIDGRTAVALLEAQGSDPEFFSLDHKGNDLEDY